MHHLYHLLGSPLCGYYVDSRRSVEPRNVSLPTPIPASTPYPLPEGMSQDSGDSVMTHELISRGTGVTNQTGTKNQEQVEMGINGPNCQGIF